MKQITKKDGHICKASCSSPPNSDHAHWISEMRTTKVAASCGGWRQSTKPTSGWVFYAFWKRKKIELTLRNSYGEMTCRKAFKSLDNVRTELKRNFDSFFFSFFEVKESSDSGFFFFGWNFCCLVEFGFRILSEFHARALTTFQIKRSSKCNLEWVWTSSNLSWQICEKEMLMLTEILNYN